MRHSTAATAAVRIMDAVDTLPDMIWALCIYLGAMAPIAAFAAILFAVTAH